MEMKKNSVDGTRKSDESNITTKISEQQAQDQWDRALYMIDFKSSDSVKDLNVKNCCESLHYDA